MPAIQSRGHIIQISDAEYAFLKEGGTYTYVIGSNVYGCKLRNGNVLVVVEAHSVNSETGEQEEIEPDIDWYQVDDDVVGGIFTLKSLEESETEN